MVISKSTFKDLKGLSFKNIKIVRLGLSLKSTHSSKKEDLILFIGRLIVPKGPKDAIVAFKKICDQKPQMRLIIAGQGKESFVRSLKNLSSTLNLSKKISFAGRVSDATKVNLLKRAKIILIPSIREGWNLVATEATSLGCVPIAYNVEGLRDSIQNNKTGILTRSNPQALARSTIRLLDDEMRRSQMQRNGENFVKKFSWENCYQDFKNFIDRTRTIETPS